MYLCDIQNKKYVRQKIIELIDNSVDRPIKADFM